MLCSITHDMLCLKHITHDMLCYMTHVMLCYIAHVMLCYKTHDKLCYITHVMYCYITVYITDFDIISVIRRLLSYNCYQMSDVICYVI